ncbi:MAG: radical SAM protein [Flavobacteriaceae bacterium]|nr:radical SAM protein [Bacteroidia bacterium]MBT8287567.1 radical SAM protein [Bacteroidia bacterium]NNF73788.1 radical SAM protein [Flavobacteriaceae bacterium]NNK71676.1 radical SAM protein [Flavobacteriaceae bacterium]
MTTKNVTIKLGSRLIEHAEVSARSTSESKIVSGFRLRLLHTAMRLHIVLIAAKCYKNPIDWLSALKYLIKIRRQFLGNHKLQKVMKIDRRYYMGIYIPAWFSSGFEQFVMNELKSYKPIPRCSNRFNTAFMAITSKCPLQCDHCYEWDRLNKKEIDYKNKLKFILAELNERGVNQVHFTGGEPLMKTDRLIDLLKNAPKSIDYWITTSGYTLDQNKAKRLKKAGIKGIIVSLDHFSPEEHNKFRHHDQAYHWALEAIKNTISQGMIAALSLCVTPNFATEENLLNYMILARDLGVSFVQLLEPKAIGRYKNKDVSLSSENIILLESFFLKMNFERPYRSFPIIGYHGQYQRRQGCLSAGKRSIYLDMEGNLHACPFCQKKAGNILEPEFDDQLEQLVSAGCSAYN